MLDEIGEIISACVSALPATGLKYYQISKYVSTSTGSWTHPKQVAFLDKGNSLPNHLCICLSTTSLSISHQAKGNIPKNGHVSLLLARCIRYPLHGTKSTALQEVATVFITWHISLFSRQALCIKFKQSFLKAHVNVEHWQHWRSALW